MKAENINAENMKAENEQQLPDETSGSCCSFFFYRNVLKGQVLTDNFSSIGSNVNAMHSGSIHFSSLKIEDI